MNSRRQPNTLTPTGTKNADGYLTASFNGRNLYIHRIAWAISYGEWPQIVDHINRDRADNRLANLRQVTPGQNMQNAGLRSDNPSGFTGVVWDPKAGKWRAQVHHQGRRHTFGRHARLEDAVAAQRAGAAKLHSHSRVHIEETA